MLRIVAIAGLALLGLPFGVRAGEPEGTAGPPTAGAAVAVEFAVITVNGRAITPSYLALVVGFDRRFKPLAASRAESLKRNTWSARQEESFRREMDLAYQRALREVVLCEILRGEAERMKAVGYRGVAEHQVEAHWRKMLKEAGGPADLAREQGLSVAALKDLARDELMATAYRQVLHFHQTLPTPQEVRDYYQHHSEELRRPESVRARAIVINRFIFDAAGRRVEREGARRRAEEVLELLKPRPEDFPALAAKYSEDPGSAGQDGNLGLEAGGLLVARGDYEPALERALFGVRAGELSGVVEAPDNYYVIQVLQHFAAGVPPFEEIETEVARSCFNERLRKVEELFFREMYDKILVLDEKGRRVPAERFFGNRRPPGAPQPSPSPSS